MKKYIVLLILGGIAGVFAYGWETVITVDGGHQREMSIGMADGASDGFDRDIDIAAPPVPPVGFYCYFPLNDPEFDFLNAAWKDMRAPSASAEWHIHLVRPEQPPQIIFSGLPQIGKLSINNIDAVEESLALTFAKSDSILRIVYSRGFWEESVSTIDFSTKFDAEAVIVVKDAAGNPVRRLPDMFLRAGEQSIGWNGTDNMGAKVEPGIYYTRVSLRAGADFSDFEVETIVKNWDNKEE